MGVALSFLQGERHKIAGFSLVELSLVLVVLGLVTGGILTGQSLIRASELRAVTTELKEFHTAVSMFKEKYYGLPGDIPNATDFWGSAWGGTCYHAWAATGDYKKTCNGNGDGQFTTSGGNMGLYVEMFMFWQQLADAELIPGQYVGSAIWHRDNAHIGLNAPASKFPNAGWTLKDEYFEDHVPSMDTVMYGRNELPLLFGGQAPNYELTTPVLTNEEAWSIDKKIDDGNGSKGKVVMDTLYGDCRDTTTVHPVKDQYTYKLSFDGTACALMFFY